MRILNLMFKPLALAVIAIAVMAMGHGVVKADEVTLTGYTNGCFNCASPVNSAASRNSSILPRIQPEYTPPNSAR